MLMRTLVLTGISVSFELVLVLLPTVCVMKEIIRNTLFECGLELNRLVRVNERARHLNLDEVTNEDYFLCSHPRTGNTWTRLILAGLIQPDLEEINLDTIDALVPDLNESLSQGIVPRRVNGKRFMKLHQCAFDVFKKVIYNVRDGRDAEVSTYQYASRALGFEGSFEDFLFNRERHVFGLWHEHVREALALQAKHPDRIFILKYEDLKSRFVETVEALVTFAGLPVSRQRIEALQQITSIDRVKKAATSDKQDARKVHTLNSGKVGGASAFFTPQTERYFVGAAYHEMKALGYIE